MIESLLIAHRSVGSPFLQVRVDVPEVEHPQCSSPAAVPEEALLDGEMFILHVLPLLHPGQLQLM